MNKFMYDYYEFTRVYPPTFLKLISSLEVYNLEVCDDKVSFYCKRKYRKSILKTTNYYQNTTKIIQGFNKSIKLVVLCVVFCLILSISFFAFLNNKIMRIEFKGDYPAIEYSLLLALNEHGLVKYSDFLDIESLISIENELYNEFDSKLEFLEIRRVGSILCVSYTKRREKFEDELLTDSVYATKSGVVKKVLVNSGQVNVQPNQFVEKGELLIDDTIIKSNKEEVYVGCNGSIFAYTWYCYEVKSYCYENESEDESFVRLIGEARDRVNENINCNGEYIDKESIIDYKYNKSIIYLKIHYTLVEDITK